MKAAILALVAFSIMAAPAYADRARTGRGADADGDRAARYAQDRTQEIEDPGAALLILRALIEQLVEDGVLLPGDALQILDRARSVVVAGAAAREENGGQDGKKNQPHSLN